MAPAKQGNRQSRGKDLAIDLGKDGDEIEAKKKVMAGQEGDQSAAEKMIMGGRGDIERDEWWLVWLNWDTHDPPSLIHMMGRHGSTSYDLQENGPYQLPPINNDTMVGGLTSFLKIREILREEWWFYWLNGDNHIDPAPSLINMMGIPPINNEAMAPVGYWNAVENEDKYRNAIKKEAVAPVKYWNEHAWKFLDAAGAGGRRRHAASYKFKKVYDLGATTTYDMPIKRKRTCWLFSQGCSSSWHARDQTRKRSRSVGEMASRELVERSRSNIRAFAQEMLKLHRMQVKNSKREAASTPTMSSLGERKSNRRNRNTDHEHGQLFAEASASFNPCMEFCSSKINGFHENDDRAR